MPSIFAGYKIQRVKSLYLAGNLAAKVAAITEGCGANA
jgi:hypothetical protein